MRNRQILFISKKEKSDRLNFCLLARVRRCASLALHESRDEALRRRPPGRRSGRSAAAQTDKVEAVRAQPAVAAEAVHRGAVLRAAAGRGPGGGGPSR